MLGKLYVFKNIQPIIVTGTRVPLGSAVQLSFIKLFGPIPLAFYILSTCVPKSLLKCFWKCYSLNSQKLCFFSMQLWCFRNKDISPQEIQSSSLRIPSSKHLRKFWEFIWERYPLHAYLVPYWVLFYLSIFCYSAPDSPFNISSVIIEAIPLSISPLNWTLFYSFPVEDLEAHWRGRGLQWVQGIGVKA